MNQREQYERILETNPEAWTLWEYNNGAINKECDEWRNCTSHPVWYPYTLYRLK